MILNALSRRIMSVKEVVLHVPTSHVRMVGNVSIKYHPTLANAAVDSLEKTVKNITENSGSLSIILLLTKTGTVQ